MLKHKLVIKVDWWSKTPFCLIKSYSLCGATPTYLPQRLSSRLCLWSKGDMDNTHICQLHYKIAWVHHERPNFYKSIYAVLKILDKEPHLLKCGSSHSGSTSINMSWMILHSRYGSSCLVLARKMVTTCFWLTSQIMERYSENLQVNSSRLHKLSLL